MVQLKRFADQATPTFTDFAEAAPNITRSTKALGPFAHAATPALLTLGQAAQKSQQPIVNSDPTLVKIRNLARKAPPAATSLTKLLSTARKTGGYEQLMHLIYNTAGAVNGFDTKGHFLRAVLQVTSCTTLVSSPTPGGGCATRWGDQAVGATPGATPAAAKAAILQRVHELEAANGGTSATGGVPLDAQGDAAGASSSSAKPAKSRKPHAPSLSATKDLLNTIIGKPGHVNNGGTPSGTYTTPSQGQAP